MFNQPVAGVGRGKTAQNPARTICLSFLFIIALGTLLLMLNGVDEKIPVSRRRVSNLKKALGI